MFLSSEALLGALRSASSNPSSLTSTLGASSGTVGPVSRDSGAGAGGGRNGAGGGAGGSIETEEVIMRLTKKNDQAMLTFDISGATRMGRAVRVMHDVRIEVMRPADVAKMNEPMCPEPDVSRLSVRRSSRSFDFRRER
jgi:HUS1 checkpoint protein